MSPEISTIIGAILGAIIAGSVTYFVSIKLSKRQDYNKAAAVFRESFFDEKIKLYKANLDVSSFINEETFNRHEKAKIIFEPYLSNCDLNCLRKIWETYRKYSYFETQNIAPGSADVSKEESKKAIAIIDKILSCAKPK